MLMLRLYEKWRGIYFLRDHFSAVARGRKLCVLILVYLVSAFVGLFRVVHVWGRRLLFLVLCRRRDFFHEGNDTLAEIIELGADIMKEGAS